MFVLQPKPTFKADIVIPTPGGGEGKIKFEFKHMGRKDLQAFYDGLVNGDVVRDDVDALADLIAGWEGVDTKFSREALETLLDAYPGAASAVFDGYRKALYEGKQKN